MFSPLYMIQVVQVPICELQARPVRAKLQVLPSVSFVDLTGAATNMKEEVDVLT